MLPGPLDKPPLSIYVNALSMVLVGVSADENGVLHLDAKTGEFAARLPNALASIVLVAVMYALARDLYGTRYASHVSVVAALLMALSPYAIAFSATAFTDTFMLLFMTLALWMAVSGNPGWCGLFMALSIASKPQGIFYLPLVLVCILTLKTKGNAKRQRDFNAETQKRIDTEKLKNGLVSLPNSFSHRQERVLNLLRFTVQLLTGIVILLLWDSARPETSVFTLGTVNNAPERFFASPADILPRLSKWLGFAQVLIAPGWITTLLFFVALLAIARQSRTHAVKIDLVLLGYVLGYGLLHWLAAFNTYDRYLLPILPMIVLLTSRGIVWAIQSMKNKKIISTSLRLYVSALISFLFCFGAWGASEGRIHIGGDQGNYEGIVSLAAYLNGKPVATVVYDHWLGWELGYYMGQWTDKRRTYYPTPDALVHDALLLNEIDPRYLPAPADEDLSPWLDALEEAGFEVALDYETSRFAIYRLIPPWGEADGEDVESS